MGGSRCGGAKSDSPENWQPYQALTASEEKSTTQKKQSYRPAGRFARIGEGIPTLFIRFLPEIVPLINSNVR
jgi:hypothetical protein